MARALRPIGHDDRLSLVDHLDELRRRLIVCVAAVLACFAVTFWQNDRVLELINDPIEQTAFREGDTSKDPFEQTAIFDQRLKDALQRSATLSADSARAAQGAERARLAALARALQAAADAAPDATARKPVTLGVGEPFLATFRVAGYAALLLALPLLLYQGYAFLLPAFAPSERRVVLPLMVLVPFLFVSGVVFAYVVVLPNAVDFLQNFNDDNFDILLQANDYYRFAVLVLMVMGFLFQIPVGILAITQAGIISVAQLRANRRYALLIVAVLAMLLPGTDPVTMLLAMAPLVVLYEGSILLAALLDRRAVRAREREAVEAAEEDAADEPESRPLEPFDTHH